MDIDPPRFVNKSDMFLFALLAVWQGQDTIKPCAGLVGPFDFYHEVNQLQISSLIQWLAQQLWGAFSYIVRRPPYCL